MQPDRINYEIWLVDYFDGVLDEVRVNQLFSFLEENPDINEEFEALSQYNVKPGDISFSGKNKLKKSVSDLSETQFEFLCVAASENDITTEQRDELEEMIAENRDKKKTYELINRLKLAAPNIKYYRKSDLRKLTSAQKIVRLSIISLTAAAGIAIMISLFNRSVNNNIDFKPSISSNISGDSNKVKAINNTAVHNIKIAEKKDILYPSQTNVLLPLKKPNTADMKTYTVKYAASDSTTVNQEIEHVNISKIDFKKEVILGKKEFANTLIAIKTDEISSTIASEKTGFYGFIAKTFREKILKSDYHETGSLKAYEIADAGINGLNKLLGWQMSLQKTRDAKGDLKSLYFSSKILKFNAPVKKVQL
jgi:hypothetical protein